MDGSGPFDADDPRRALNPADVLALIKANATGQFVPTSLRPANAAPSAFQSAGLMSLVRDRISTANVLRTAASAETVAPPVAPLMETPEPVLPVATPAPVIPQPDPIPLLTETARAEAMAMGREEGLIEGRVEGKAMGYAAGHAAGLAEGRAAAEAQLEEARQAFLVATRRLTEMTNADVASLANGLEQAVRKLASQRAGQAIDSHPAPFIARIEALAERVAQGVRGLELRLNPQDLAVIERHISSSDTLTKARMQPDPRLARGDIDIRADGVNLLDVLLPRMVS